MCVEIKKSSCREISPTLSLSVWSIKKLGSVLTAFLSSCSPCLRQINARHFSGLILSLPSPNQSNLFVQHLAHAIGIKQLCAPTLTVNIRVAGTLPGLVFLSLGRGSFMMSFWKITVCLNRSSFQGSFFFHKSSTKIFIHRCTPYNA